MAAALTVMNERLNQGKSTRLILSIQTRGNRPKSNRKPLKTKLKQGRDGDGDGGVGVDALALVTTHSKEKGQEKNSRRGRKKKRKCSGFRSHLLIEEIM